LERPFGKEINKIKFENKSSDLNGALRNVTSDYEGKNLAGVVVLRMVSTTPVLLPFMLHGMFRLLLLE